jgi:hypothetical protein
VRCSGQPLLQRAYKTAEFRRLVSSERDEKNAAYYSRHSVARNFNATPCVKLVIDDVSSLESASLIDRSGSQCHRLSVND